MVRLPALDPDERIGSLFLNPGGPGGSGVDFAVFAAPFLYSPELRSRFDLVGFDPRGVARSTALKCFGNLNQAVSIFQAPVIAFPKDAAEAEAWFGNDQRLADACAKRGNKVLDHMSTGNVARDLDLLRQAVGDGQLTYAGYSYGSYLGVTYANLFPDNVRAMIVDGVLNPIDWSTGHPGEQSVPFSSRLRSNVGAQDTLDELFRLCDSAGPPACAFAPDSAARFQALAEHLLDNEPVLIDVPAGPNGELVEIPIFYGDLIGITLGALYDSFSWPVLAEDLAFLEAAIAGTSATARATFEIGRTFQAYTAKRGFPRYFNFVESFPAVACADSDNPDRIADWVAAAGEITFDDYFRQIWTYASSPCLAFPTTGDGRSAGPFDAETANPVLVASTLYDPVRPGNPGPRRARGRRAPAQLRTSARRRLGSHDAWDLQLRVVLQ
jgi:pimeloyl-ACP methyl ester carboxylesterase